MNKLPVFRTFGNALGFTIGNFFTIFRLTWLPFAALLATNFALGLYLQRMVVNKRLDPFSIFAHIDEFIFLQVVMLFLHALVIAAAAVAIHRVILFGDRKPGSYFNFAFGTTEFLYVLMGVLSTIFILVAVSAVFGPVIYFLAHGDFHSVYVQIQEWMRKPPKPDFATMAPLIVGYFVFWIIAAYIGIGLAVWPPAIVATRRLSLGEAWRLTRGNAWSIFGLFFLTGLVIWVVAAGAGAAFYFSMHDKFEQVEIVKSDTAAPNTGAETKEAAAAQDTEAETKEEAAAREALQRKMEQEMQPYAPLFWLSELLISIISTGFGVALLSYSYKALKGYDAKEPIPEDA